MRTFLSGAGSDSTSAVQAHLAAHRELLLTDLYVIKTAPCYAGKYLGQTFLLTAYPSSLVWAYRGTFKPASISRGQVQSKIGLESDTLQITWSPRDSDVLATDGSGNTLLSVIQGFGHGVFDNGTAEVWRCVMPAVGDAATLGACLIFSGRTGNIVNDRLKVVMTILSRVEVLNQQVPTNLIEPTNIVAQYTTGQVLANGPASFALVSGSTRKILYANPVSAPGGYTPKSGSWDDGYVVMSSPGKLGGSYRGIRSQIYDAGISHHVFYLAEELPFDPAVADTFQAFIPVPRDQDGAATQSSDYAGFRYVPSAINSTVVIG